MTGRRPVSWLRSTLAALAGGGLALGLMYWARAAFQLRTLPERLMETFLLVIPPDQFEAAIERFGPMAKDFALIGTYVVMALVLAVIGACAARYLPVWGILGMGVVLWLLAGAVIFPITGGGLFATGLLLQSPLLVNLVYLGIGLAYACCLLAARLGPAAPSEAASGAETRRVFLTGVASAAVAFVATTFVGRSAGRIVSALPQASLPVPANPAPAPSEAAPAGTSEPASTALPSVSAAAVATPPPSATANPYPQPPPERALARDKDGALLAVNRPKGQLQASITPNEDFYTVTKNAAGDPILQAQDWRLIVDGAVKNPVQVDYLTLRMLPPVTFYKTLECISNLTAKCELTAFGCDLLSTAKWTGARLMDVLALAGGLKPGVVAIAAIGADEFSSSIPAAAASDPNVILAYEMNNGILPREHGFPVRLIIPGTYGLKNAKWIVNLKPMTQPYIDWYGERNWSQTAIVKTMSRIDEPQNGASVPAGPNRVAGVAYAGTRGVAKVEVSADNGRTWQPADFAEPPLGPDTFVRWQSTFQIAAGQALSLVVRATDGSGQLQTETFNLPQPNGGTGWHSVDVKAA
ncbi:MAG: molybdopterin-dependent oxidoreductase [Chloroflexi bacterium]|nr:molybdopterin-dependent oxidoreductase [Chloroflexota bacterium]